MSDPLEAVSPLDGRYAEHTSALGPYVSEGALHRARVYVEVEYLLAIAELAEIDVELDQEVRADLRSLYEHFGLADARAIRAIEVEGDDRRAATNHDVKAVEYWLRDRLDERGLEAAVPLVHFGLTSEDVNNLAYRLLLRDALEEVLAPAIVDLAEHLRNAALDHRSLAMLSRTHGQPASPTTYGKELAVYADRLRRGRRRLEAAVDGLAGKFGGATGTLAAHEVAAPAVDWRSFAAAFVEDLGLTYLPLTTQVNPNDDLAAAFDALAGVASVVLDLDRDMWLYISVDYLRQGDEAGAVGSSTMPHKVNPIDFENSEGNLERARADLRFLADTVTTSRLQRDLSDSTVMRTSGAALAHALLGLRKTAAGLETVAPNEAAMAEDLAAHPAVLGEAIQTALRRVGDRDAYERVKAATRGVEVDAATFAAEIDRIRAVDPDLAARLESLVPSTYVGDAADLVDEL